MFSPHLFLRAYIASYISVETSRVSWKLGSFDGNGFYFWISCLVQCSIAGLQLLQSSCSHSSVLLQNQNLHSPFCIQPPGPYNCINFGQWSFLLCFSDEADSIVSLQACGLVQGHYTMSSSGLILVSAAASVYISREHGRLRTTRHLV